MKCPGLFLKWHRRTSEEVTIKINLNGCIILAPNYKSVLRKDVLRIENAKWIVRPSGKFSFRRKLQLSVMLLKWIWE